MVHAPPLYIQEKIKPKVLIDDLLRQSEKTEAQKTGFQTDIFADFNGIPTEAAKTEFYRHDANWTNRMILGDSLQVIPAYRKAEEPAMPKAPLFAHVAAEALLGYGVPAEWLDDVQKADEDALLALADHLPAEAAEALLQLATGDTPIVAQPLRAAAQVNVAPSPFDHPDAQRRFRVVNNVEELERALAYPWEKWIIFLHPEQQWVEKEYSGPTRVSGSAGMRD